MDHNDLDQLLQSYKHSTDVWVEAIRTEESLATPDHSMTAMEHWDTAGLHIHDAERAAKTARDLYKNELRKKNYGF
jgi:hypothetical protein